MKSQIFVSLALFSFLSSPALRAGETTILDVTIRIEVSNPTEAFQCTEGDSGFLSTQIVLNSHLIPYEISSNFRNDDTLRGLRADAQNRTATCAQAMQPIFDEIQTQGGLLMVNAHRTVFRSALPFFDNDLGFCALFAGERVTIQIGPLEFFDVNTFFIRNLSEAPYNIGYSDCRAYMPAGI